MTKRIVVLALVLALVAVACQRSVGGSAPTTAPTTGPATSVELVPRPDQTNVTGTLTSLTADNAAGPPLRPPFTITLADRGRGHADITGVLVGGKHDEIFWYGGQPLPVSGTGELDLSGAPVAIVAGGITWTLDGPARSLTAGHFVLGAPVAVGAGGLAESHDSIAFDAGATSTIETTGRATVHLPPAPVHLGGPGRLTLAGELQVRTASGRRAVQSITFGSGSYSIDLAPVAAGFTVEATLQGPVSFG